MTSACFSTHELANLVLEDRGRHSCEVLAELIAPDKVSTAHGSEWMWTQFGQLGAPLTRAPTLYRGRVVGFELRTEPHKERLHLAKRLLNQPDQTVEIELIDSLI